MKTKFDLLEEKIVKITSLIHKKFPELSKYISEMPVKSSGKDGVTVKDLEEYYHSLEDYLTKYAETHSGKGDKKNLKPPVFPGYPPYPSSEDIYQHSKEEGDLNPEDLSKKKTLNEKNFREERSGDDLDVPGSELDDQQESVGSEDEENNYYSLSGDDHNDLET